MKKKLINISLALLLVLSVCLSISVSASAESGNKPVAWVNFTGAASGKVLNPGHYGGEPNAYPLPQVRLNVKQLADTTTVGHCSLRFLGAEADFQPFYPPDVTYHPKMDFIIDSSWFMDSGTFRLAEVIVLWEEDYYFWGLLDGGEPGSAHNYYSGKDWFEVYQYIGTEDKPSLPVDFLNPGSDWKVYLPLQPILPDNIQIHISEDY